jgi:hypothetical protein
VSLEDRAGEELRRQAEEAERHRRGVEAVRVSGLEFVALLAKHRIATVRLRTDRGPTRGWILFRQSHEAIAGGSAAGLALTPDGCLYHCSDLWNETSLIGGPLASLNSHDAYTLETAAAQVLSGTFGPTVEQNASSQRTVWFVVLAILGLCFLCVVIGMVGSLFTSRL